MAAVSAVIAVSLFGSVAHSAAVKPRDIPAQAQVIDQRSFNVMPTVLPATQANGTTIQTLGIAEAQLHEKPFHIYDDAFYEIIGTNPTLTLFADAGKNPLYHEAPIWYPPTDEFFVAQAQVPSEGIGLNKSSIISKFSLKQVMALSNERNATGKVDIVEVKSDVPVINPNGGTNYKGQLLWVGDGQGTNGAPAIFLMDGPAPHKTKVILNNYFGRQFNSIDDVAVHPCNSDIYFTDPLYGWYQDFRPEPGLPRQVYRFSPDTGAVTVVADGFDQPNGIAFSPGGEYAYVTDTGMAHVLFGFNMSNPATVYRYNVSSDGSFHDRKVFAFASTGVPDGIHCDTAGNVYVGCGDGVQVFTPAGKLIGKIFIGGTSANFQFAGKGRMVVLGETKLFYAALKAEGQALQF